MGLYLFCVPFGETKWLLNDIVSLQYIIGEPPIGRNAHIATEWHRFFEKVVLPFT